MHKVNRREVEAALARAGMATKDIQAMRDRRNLIGDDVIAPTDCKRVYQAPSLVNVPTEVALGIQEKAAVAERVRAISEAPEPLPVVQQRAPGRRREPHLRDGIVGPSAQELAQTLASAMHRGALRFG